MRGNWRPLWNASLPTSEWEVGIWHRISGNIEPFFHQLGGKNNPMQVQKSSYFPTHTTWTLFSTKNYVHQRVPTATRASRKWENAVFVPLPTLQYIECTHWIDFYEQEVLPTFLAVFLMYSFCTTQGFIAVSCLIPSLIVLHRKWSLLLNLNANSPKKVSFCTF